MIPLSNIFKKYTGGYKLTKSQEKNYHLMYINDIKISAKNEKEPETLTQIIRIYNQDMGMDITSEKYEMFLSKSG